LKTHAEQERQERKTPGNHKVNQKPEKKAANTQ